MSADCTTCGQPWPTKSDKFRFRRPLYAESFGIIGVTQHGKSTFAKAWAAWLVRMLFSVIAWDPADEWGVDGMVRKHCTLGPLKDSVFFSNLASNPGRWLSRRHLQLAVKPDPYPSPPPMQGKRVVSLEEWFSSQFTRFCHLVKRWTPKGPLALFIDECNLLAEHAKAALDDISERWAKEEIVPIFLSQRWMHFTKNMRGQIAWVVSFKQVDTTDLWNLRRDVGADFARAVPWLQPGSYRVRNRRQPDADSLAHL